ncbi:MAG: HIT family protein [Gammaproteobacteria bacterium]|nr:HIT family protein [Gammaproteobacteria bacterium]
MNNVCPLCVAADEKILWQDDRARVILVDEVDYPGFCRVIWQTHVAEMSDLPAADRDHLMNLVFAVETAQRQVLEPDKINLAALGNQVPHLHWHIIPRFRGDATFPDAIWAPPRRRSAARAVDTEALTREIRLRLNGR